jgi:ubiquinone/menaquinone biosynthesis C-methylase UbiE
MSSMMESTLTPEQHALLGKVLVAQTESLGRLEIPVVADLLARHGPRVVLDVGCGEGSFLLQLAPHLPATHFLGIDHSQLAVADAEARRQRDAVPNVSFQAAFFDAAFDAGPFGAITTRYTLQHASHPREFVDAAFARLATGGVFVAMESLDAYTDCHQSDAVWERFRAALAAVHHRVGSDQNIGKALGALMKRAGFRDIQVRLLVCSPSTVGWERFRTVVQASAELANTFFPDLFDPALRLDVEAWLADRELLEAHDPYMCSAIACATRG